MEPVEKVLTTEGYERTIDSHVKNLRAKIGDNPRNPKWLHTVHGVGYRSRIPRNPANSLRVTRERNEPSTYNGSASEGRRALCECGGGAARIRRARLFRGAGSTGEPHQGKLARAERRKFGWTSLSYTARVTWRSRSSRR